MVYQRVVGFCPDLVTRIDELVAEKFEYEYFDDPISDARAEMIREMDSYWYRRQLFEAFGGINHVALLRNELQELAKVVEGHELLEACCLMYRPFILHLSDEGFFAIDCIEANSSKLSVALQVEENNKRKFIKPSVESSQ